MNRIYVTAVLVAWALLSGCSDRELSSANGQSSEGEISSEVVCPAPCRLGFTRLSARPELYEGKSIFISGYLAITDGYLSLQESEYSYLSSTGDDSAILFFVPKGVQEEIVAEHLNSYVSVLGVFTAHREDRVPGFGHFSGETMVSERVVNDRPESVDDLRIRLEDMKASSKSPEDWQNSLVNEESESRNFGF